MELKSYQKEGVEFLGERSSAGLFFEQGCVSGDAILSINRGGKVKKFCLRDVYLKMNGLGLRKWDLNIPTYTKSLVDGIIKYNRIVKALDKGIKEVFEIGLSSGKKIQLTSDHEILTPNGWVETLQLEIGSEVLTNGRDCYGSKNNNYKRGHYFDKDGYVVVTGMKNNPRSNVRGNVYEHLLVMEKKIGRPVARKEIVHHINGDRGDNRIENLELLNCSQHHTIHKRSLNFNMKNDKHGNVIIKIPIADKIIYKKRVGLKQVYDLVMENPARNFVANGIIVHNCGKTLVMLEHLKNLGGIALPILIVAPLSGVGVWEQEIEKFGYNFSVQELVGTRPQREKQLAKPADIYVINYDGLRVMQLHLARIKWNTIVLDECFVGNTKVKTPNGYVKIKDIRVGDIVCNAVGEGRVSHIFCNKRTEVVKISTTYGDLFCTPNHPFFTNDGWVFACNLNQSHCIKTHEETLRMVQKTTDKRTNDAKILREVLLCEMENEPSLVCEVNKYKGQGGKSFRILEENLQKTPRVCKDEFGTNEGKQSDEDGWYKGEGFKDVNKDRPQAFSERRKWNWSDKGRASFVEAINWFEMELCNIFGKKNKGLSNKLQDRPSLSKNKTGNRSRRIQSQGSCETTSGQKEGTETSGAWVESVESIERESFEQYGFSSEGVEVYNLEVEGHPSYIVTESDLVVHNCHRCKSRSAKQTAIATRLAHNTRFRYLMTGTPVTNSPEDIWSQMFILDPQHLGNFYSFCNRYIDYRKINIKVGFGKYREIRKATKFKNLPELSQRLEKYTLRKTKKECLDLPEKIYKVIHCHLTPEQKRHYWSLKLSLATELNNEHFKVVNAASVIQKLQQVCQGFIYDGDKAQHFESCKWLMLKDLMKDIGNESIIIFTWYRYDAQFLAESLKKEGYDVIEYDGKHSDRVQQVKDFQESNTPKIFLSNIEKAKEAITLTKATSVIYYGNSWNYGSRVQSEDRAHRIGQRNNVVYFDFVVPNTIDNIIYETLKTKGEMADKITGDTKRLAQMICEMD